MECRRAVSTQEGMRMDAILFVGCMAGRGFVWDTVGLGLHNERVSRSRNQILRCSSCERSRRGR